MPALQPTLNSRNKKRKSSRTGKKIESKKSKPNTEQQQKQDHLRMNVAPDQTIILGLQILLDHRSLSSIDKKNLDEKAKKDISTQH